MEKDTEGEEYTHDAYSDGRFTPNKFQNPPESLVYVIGWDVMTKAAYRDWQAERRAKK
jgi:hypothetical protein